MLLGNRDVLKKSEEKMSYTKPNRCSKWVTLPVLSLSINRNTTHNKSITIQTITQHPLEAGIWPQMPTTYQRCQACTPRLRLKSKRKLLGRANQRSTWWVGKSIARSWRRNWKMRGRKERHWRKTLMSLKKFPELLNKNTLSFRKQETTWITKEPIRKRYTGFDIGIS